MDNGIDNSYRPIILVVEDSHVNAELLKSILTLDGFQVQMASNGQAALALLRESTPDLILLDIRMPGMDGLQVCRIIKADEAIRRVPVIFITVVEDIKVKVEAFRTGAADYITKPFMNEEVLARVRSHLAISEYKKTIEGAVNAAGDLPRQKSDSEKLATMAYRYKAILDSVPDIIMEVDNDKVYTWANKAGLDFFGEEVIGKEASRYFIGEQETFSVVQPVFSGDEDEVVYVESWQRRHDGEKRLLAWWCRTLRSAGGKVQGALSAARDITESRIAEASVRESEQLFSSMFYQSPVAIIITEPFTGRIIDVNETFLRDMEYIREEVIGKTTVELGIFNDPEDRDKLIGILKDKKRVFAFECGFRSRTGNLVRGLVSIVFIQFRGEMVQLNTVIDITERISAEQKLKELNEALDQIVQDRTVQLESVIREIEDFSYSVSHDLRVPLRAISGFSKILLDEYRDDTGEEIRHLLDGIITNTTRMNQLIDNLLTLSRLGRKEMVLTPVDMNLLASEVWRELISVHEKEPPQFTLEKLPPAYGDQNLIRQVITNLFSNAIKFSSKKEKSVVMISGKKEGNECIYSVSDNGVGFDMQYAGKLFGVFQRLHRVDEFDGSGVGLAIVHRIITRHGGKVWADAAENKGATFCFSLPSPGSMK